MRISCWMFPNNVVATPEISNLGGVLYFSLFCVYNMFANRNPLRLQSLPSASSTMTARWRHYYITLTTEMLNLLLCVPAFIITNGGSTLF